MASPLHFLGRAAGIFLPLYPDEYDKSVLPAFPYCPVYTADLQPGDILARSTRTIF